MKQNFLLTARNTQYWDKINLIYFILSDILDKTVWAKNKKHIFIRFRPPDYLDVVDPSDLPTVHNPKINPAELQDPPPPPGCSTCHDSKEVKITIPDDDELPPDYNSLYVQVPKCSNNSDTATSTERAWVPHHITTITIWICAQFAIVYSCRRVLQASCWLILK